MEIDLSHIRVIGFDADDTLWVNETYFRDTEHEFARLLSAYETENKIDQELFKMEMQNLGIYGYGIKGFMLSMIESAIDLSNGKIDSKTISKILDMGKEMILKPVEILDGVEEVLKSLNGKYRLILLTKGDLLDQERKLDRSGLSKYFHHIEVLSDKKEENYSNLLSHLEIPVDEFLMIGNSLKSDVLPLINIGASAVHVPFHTTWAHEQVKENDDNGGYHTLDNIREILKYL
ncbi:HAD family hydrolase [Robertkochia solimangrovi]|uniref:HAD family hydrolase n=1 Tax=Robertkochia solimangrovi TaxID=2213046 RepID=UPI00117F12B5|nr:HAD family hydrolase [Robertkochia solimangrovi]TRZ42899.1 HAD family hydrolase [Robertkochia solimangrovi]